MYHTAWLKLSLNTTNKTTVKLKFFSRRKFHKEISIWKTKIVWQSRELE